MCTNIHMLCLLCPRGDKSNYLPNLITCWQTSLGPMWCKWHTTARWVNTTSPGPSMITRAKVVTAGRKQCWGPTHLRAAESSPLLLSPLLVSSWIRNPNHTSKSPTCFCFGFFLDCGIFFLPRTCFAADVEVRQSALMGFAVAFYLPAGGMSLGD